MIKLIFIILIFFYLSIGTIIGIRLSPFRHVVANILFIIFESILWVPNIVADAVIVNVKR